MSRYPARSSSCARPDPLEVDTAGEDEKESQYAASCASVGETTRHRVLRTKKRGVGGCVCLCVCVCVCLCVIQGKVVQVCGCVCVCVCVCGGACAPCLCVGVCVCVCVCVRGACAPCLCVGVCVCVCVCLSVCLSVIHGSDLVQVCVNWRYVCGGGACVRVCVRACVREKKPKSRNAHPVAPRTLRHIHVRRVGRERRFLAGRHVHVGLLLGGGGWAGGGEGRGRDRGPPAPQRAVGGRHLYVLVRVFPDLLSAHSEVCAREGNGN